MKKFTSRSINHRFKPRYAVNVFIALAITILSGTTESVNAGALETGGLDGGTKGTSIDSTLHVRGMVVQTLADGLIIHCPVPGATGNPGFHPHDDVYVKGAVSRFGSVDLPVKEAGTFSYKDKTGKIKTVRAYEVTSSR